MKTLITICALALPMAVWAAAGSPDESFYKKAAEAGLSEVQLGQLASDKSPDPDVKNFGAMMVKDHTAANQKLQSIASAKGIDLPTKPSIGEMATKTKLDVLSGQTFDKSYIKSQVKAHEETIALLKKEIASGQDDDAKAFARSVLPTVQKHLTAARGLAGTAKTASAQ
jgi:putative membrane protein